MVEEIEEEETNAKAGGEPAFALVSLSPYSSNLRMEAICSAENSVDFQRAT
jgi:hypothetical protein